MHKQNEFDTLSNPLVHTQIQLICGYDVGPIQITDVSMLFDKSIDRNKLMVQQQQYMAKYMRGQLLAK